MNGVRRKTSAVAGATTAAILLITLLVAIPSLWRGDIGLGVGTMVGGLWVTIIARGILREERADGGDDAGE
ncbi:hypothetical protein [Streptomyces melanosporofaciens]|uniref:Uncharacterized protein n=1 Tax=Streptomyces melanosporofaciens TaxID=67327 RepID=A0A1H4I8N6_STRMJ|nr:hypothetical protein [Streptomyces melanosporofaciens]SEB30313.1 hypothetical protein SAMN04490356_0194 [Streptomyces melanosporofaciens]